MNENMTFGEKLKLKMENGKAWALAKASNLKNWIVNHPYEAMALGGSIVAGATKGVRMAKHHEEKVHRERDFYDPRTGRYTRAKRKPKNYELDEIEFRYRNGESYNEILREMNLRQ